MAEYPTGCEVLMHCSFHEPLGSNIPNPSLSYAMKLVVPDVEEVIFTFHIHFLKQSSTVSEHHKLKTVYFIFIIQNQLAHPSISPCFGLFRKKLKELASQGTCMWAPFMCSKSASLFKG